MIFSFAESWRQKRSELFLIDRKMNIFCFSCAVMLEIIRLFVTSPASELKNDVIFLLNGAEESILPASHAFITQHPWAKDIKVKNKYFYQACTSFNQSEHR